MTQKINVSMVACRDQAGGVRGVQRYSHRYVSILHATFVLMKKEPPLLMAGICTHDCYEVHCSNLIIGKTNVSRIVIENGDKRRRIISSIHGSNHLGVHRTNHLVSKKYYWPGMYSDISTYVSKNMFC